MAFGDDSAKRVRAQLALATAAVSLAVLKRNTSMQPKDGDGDGFVHDGPGQTPAPDAPKPTGAGSNINSGVLAALGPDQAKQISSLIASRAPADQIAKALQPALDKLQGGKPTLGEGEQPTPAFWASRTYQGGKKLPETVDGLVETAEAYAGKGGVQKDHKAILVVGLPAAGKSTFAEHLAEQTGSAIWDSDDAKKVIPEFKGGLAADAVHEESKAISNLVGRRLMDDGTNIVHPIVGHDMVKLKKVIETFRAQGYEADVVHVAVSPDEAMRRMAGRYLSSGRLIPPAVLANYGTKPGDTYHKLRDAGVLKDGYAEINADGPRGSERVTEANSVPGLVGGHSVFGEGAGGPARAPDRGHAGQVPHKRPQDGLPGGGHRGGLGRPVGKTRTLLASASAHAALARIQAEVTAEKMKRPTLSWFFGDKHPRKPKGSPGGGEFAPKGGGGISGKMSDGDWDNFFDSLGEDSKHFADEKSSLAAGLGAHGKKPTTGLFGGFWGGGGDHQVAADLHPGRDDKGHEVWINYPSKASPESTWSDSAKAATWTPGSKVPAKLNGVPVAPWSAPTTHEGWQNVDGQDHELDMDQPFYPSKGKGVGAGVIIQEPDGRIWLTAPTNSYGGYRNTFPKGTYETDIPSLQANAIKEAYEETGLKVKITGVLGDFERTTSRARVYLAQRVGGSPAAMGWESQATRLVPLDKARQFLNMAHVDHPIVDALERHLGHKVGKAFNPNQPRWPKGTPLGGQFKSIGGFGFTEPPKIAWKADGSGPGVNDAPYKKAQALYDQAVKGNIANVQLVAQGSPDSGIPGYGFAEAAQYAATGGKGMNSQAKWKAQINQYAQNLVNEHQAKMAATSTVETLSGPPKITGWKLLKDKGSIGGTNPGGLYEDGSGQKWLVKGNLMGKDDARAQNEVLASKLMQAVGTPAPEIKLVDLGDKYGGGKGVAVKWIDKLLPYDGTPLMKAAAQDDFATHAWLGNWDVVGLHKDNIALDPATGNVFNIDPGGAILYRAQGSKKGAGQFGPVASEWDTMRAKGNGASVVFGDMTESEMKDSAQKLKDADPALIHKLVMDHGPGTMAQRQELSDTLQNRRGDILHKAGLIETDPAVHEPAPANPVNAPPKTEENPVNGATPQLASGTLGVMAAIDKFHDQAGSAAAQLKYLENVKSTWLKNQSEARDIGVNNDKFTVPKGEVQAVLDHIQRKVQKLSGPAAVADLVPPAMGPHYAQIFNQLQAEHSAANIAGLEGAAKTWADEAKAFTSGEGAHENYLKVSAYAQKLADDLKVNTPDGKPLVGGGDLAGLKAAALDAGFTITAPALTQMHAKGDLAALNNFIAKNTHASQKVATAYAEALKADLEANSDTGGPSYPADTFGILHGKEPTAIKVERVKTAVAPAAPNWEGAKIPTSNSNAASHNSKVDTIKTLFEKGDADGIASLKYGVNTYGKKQVKLANDSLAALGSDLQVVGGQPKGSLGVVNTTASEAKGMIGNVKVPKKPITLSDLPAKPDFANYHGPGKPLSSKPWKNAQNQAVADQIEQAALQGDLPKLKNLTFQQLTDDAAGTPTGLTLGMNAYPSKTVSAYYNDSVQFLHDYYNPVAVPTVANQLTAKSIEQVAKHYDPKPLGTVVDKLHKNERFGFWVGLGQVTNPDAIKPAKVANFNAEDVAAGYTWFKKQNSAVKAFVGGMQSGGIMSAYRNGNISHNSQDLEELAKAAEKAAVEMPEGTTIYRWQSMSSSMLDSLNKAPAGLVVQATGPMCASYHATDTSGFGSHRLVIRYAAGAKAIPSFGSGQYQGEKEVSTLPGSRFVYLGKKPRGGTGLYDYEFLMLPHHPKASLRAKP